MHNHPLAEVFGFPPDNLSEEAERFRKDKLCPFHNKVPSCTKDKALDPLGVCTVHSGSTVAIRGMATIRSFYCNKSVSGLRQGDIAIKGCLRNLQCRAYLGDTHALILVHFFRHADFGI